MRIGIDGLPLGELKTGVGHYTNEIARGVAAAHPEDEVQVLSHLPFTPDSISSDLPNLTFVYQQVNSITKHWWTIGLPRYLRNNSFDVFHGTNYDVPLWGGCTSVLTIHDLSLMLFSETHEVRRVNRARRRLPVMARLARRIIVPTESVKSEVCEHLSVVPEKVVAIAEAPRKCFRPLESQRALPVIQRLGIEDLFILYVGAIEPRKNLITLVRAVEEIYKSTSLRPQLVIAGPNGWLSDDLFSYVEKSDIKDRMLLTGYLGDEDLRALYSTCAVMNFPALYEGAGLPPLEAMACGAPVVTSDARAVVEMVGDGARVVPAKDFQLLGRELNELMIDHDARTALIERGIKRSALFSWEKAAQMTHEVYRDAIKCGQSQRATKD